MVEQHIQNYPYANRDKGHIPELITRKQLVLDVHVKQKGVAMLTLLCTLPHILGKIFKLENEYYKYLVHFIQITQLCFSPYSESESVEQLSDLIHLFGAEWRLLYPQSKIKPKMYYLVHLVDMKTFGSLHGISCLHYEVKHGWFKDQRIRNFKNLPLSLSNKHQLYMVHKMIDINGRPSPNFIYLGDEIGEGNITSVTALNSKVHENFCAVFGYRGTFIGSVIVLKTDVLGHPTFGIIDNIYVIDEKKYFLLHLLETLFYQWQFHSFVVRHKFGVDLINWQKLKNNFPLILYKYDNKYFVMNRYSQYSRMQ